MFFSSLNDAGFQWEHIQKLKYFGDMGKGIEKFINDRKLTYWICSRHFINSFGSDTTSEWVVSELIHSENNDEFQTLFQEYDALIKNQTIILTESRMHQWDKIRPKFSKENSFIL